MRTCGILMPISSLPGKQGIGTMGDEAREFVDFLVKAGQTIWQILPVSPTGYGDSPYQSCSAFAGNPYFVDLALLQRDGLLQSEDYAEVDWGADPLKVDYGAIYQKRFSVLRKAFENWKKQRPVLGYDTPYSDDWYSFVFRNEGWLDDYALYMAIKTQNEMKRWLDWPEPLRLRRETALEDFRRQYADEILFWKFIQYEFDRQWRALKEYANESGIRIMGDIPIYVAEDSADAWAGGALFELDEKGAPARVSGCPPDYFSADGQLWGNPLYDWDYHRKTGFAWWIGRVRHALNTYDILRIDHFRGFDTYWAVPAGSPNARKGKWENGPGMELFDALRAALGELPIVAEDLGELFDSVRVLLKASGFPGMKVLQFAFDGSDNEFLPHNHTKNCVVYPGTHDNATVREWFEKEGRPKELAVAKQYLELDSAADPAKRFLKAVIASPADTAIIPMADWLGLGAEAHLNRPGVMGGNWTWRMAAGAAGEELAADIRALNAVYHRAKPDPKDKAHPAKTAEKADKPEKKEDQAKMDKRRPGRAFWR